LRRALGVASDVGVEAGGEFPRAARPLGATKADATMKHTLFMVALMAVTIPCALINPFVGLVVYFALATLYPQYLWGNDLPTDVRWSLMVGVSTLAGFVLQGFVRSRAGSRWPLQKVLMLGMAVWMVLSAVDAIDPDIAGRQLDDYSKIFLMFFVA
jgi:hypothetical protein